MDPSSDYQARVGVALAAIRDYLDVPQEAVAHLAGVSTSTISRYETGGVAPHAETLVRIARGLGVPLELLLDPPASRQEVFEVLALRRGQQRADAGELA